VLSCENTLFVFRSLSIILSIDRSLVLPVNKCFSIKSTINYLILYLEVLLEINGGPQYFGIIFLDKNPKIESEESTVIHIVPHLLRLIKLLDKILFKLQCFLVNRYMDNFPSNNPVSEKYHALQIDAAPIVEKRQLYDYE
jgi:hypothetical protein